MRGMGGLRRELSGSGRGRLGGADVGGGMRVRAGRRARALAASRAAPSLPLLASCA